MVANEQVIFDRTIRPPRYRTILLLAFYLGSAGIESNQPTMPRNFRTDESYVAEQTTRDMLRDFLTERGFTEVVDERKSHGNTQSQFIRARDESGSPVALWIRLCWREGGSRDNEGSPPPSLYLVSKRRRLLSAKAVYVCAVTRRRFSQ
jgi:hypothetical protein